MTRFTEALSYLQERLRAVDAAIEASEAFGAEIDKKMDVLLPTSDRERRFREAEIRRNQVFDLKKMNVLS